MGPMLDRHMWRADAFLAFRGRDKLHQMGTRCFVSRTIFLASEYRLAVNDASMVGGQNNNYFSGKLQGIGFYYFLKVTQRYLNIVLLSTC